MPPAQVSDDPCWAIAPSAGSIAMKQLRAANVRPGGGIADIGMRTAMLKVRAPPGGSVMCASQENQMPPGTDAQPSSGRIDSILSPPAGAPAITIFSANATWPSKVLRPEFLIMILKVQTPPATQVA